MKEFLILGGLAILSNLMLQFIIDKDGMWRMLFSGKSRLFNNIGMAGDDGSGGKSGDGAAGGGKITFDEKQQAEVNRIVQDRIAREREKYSDYETTKQKLAEFEKLNNEKAQKDLEAAKNYEEAKKGYETKLSERDKLLKEKDSKIDDLIISNSLTNEINAQNAYSEETLALLKPNTILTKDGQVRIKLKDADGIDREYSVTEGMKAFLANKPHLVKSNFKAGSGSKGGDGAAGSGAGSGQQGDDIGSLNKSLQDAMHSGEHKKAEEIKSKIRQYYKNKGVALTR